MPPKPAAPRAAPDFASDATAIDWSAAPRTRDLASMVRRTVSRNRAGRELDRLVVVITEDGTRAVLEDRAKLASKLQRSDPGVAWWLSGETCGPGECLALVAVDGVRQVVRVRLDAGDGDEAP